VVGGGLSGSPFEVGQVDGDDQLGGQPGLLRELAETEQELAGVFEGVVPPLPDRPGARTPSSSAWRRSAGGVSAPP